MYKKKNIIRYTAPLFNKAVLIGIGLPIADFLDEYEKLLPGMLHPAQRAKGEELKARGFVVPLDTGFMMWLKYLPKDPETISIMVHEVFHLTHHILKNVNIPLSVDSEEVFSYLSQHISKTILDKTSCIDTV